MKSNRGAGLLELLLAMCVFMGVLPFAYDFAKSQKVRAENARIGGKIKIVQSALERYIADRKQELLRPVSANVVRVRMSDLPGVDANEFKDEKIQLRIVKSKDSGGRAFVQGIVIFDSAALSPLRTRQISMIGGNAGGFVDGQMLYGSFGTWRTSASKIGGAVRPGGSNSVIAQTRPFKSGGDYLHRLPSDNQTDATMQSDLDFAGHDVKGVRNMDSGAARFLDVLTADAVDASKMTVSRRLDWSLPLDVFSDALVTGSISSDGRSVFARDISIASKSQFRSVSAENLVADNLYLSGFSISSDGSTPTSISITGSLDMARGHIRAIEAVVGFSGSITPKLVIESRIEDSADPAYYWDANAGDAALNDLQLTGLHKIVRSAYAADRVGTTETERIMGAVIQNSNATASDFLRALERVRQAVEAKYTSL
ncbi:MAG: hypothetical protein LBQ49_02890 [Rickettsiales bacterium]|jgi:hypothetical protein|nr:hypothetical protein [Rickettsiales bacterium]